jgi:hypothetical protein
MRNCLAATHCWTQPICESLQPMLLRFLIRQTLQVAPDPLSRYIGLSRLMIVTDLQILPCTLRAAV